MLLINLAIFVLCCLVMTKAGVMIVKALSNAASFLRIREFTLAFVLMAISTSLPDLTVGITSALQGTPEIILGAVIGANILDVSLVIGIAVILAKGIDLKKRKEVLANSMWLLPIAALPVVLFFIGNSLSQFDGAILLCVFFIYMYEIFKEGKHLRDEAIRKDEQKERIEEKKEERKEGIIDKFKRIIEFMKDWVVLGIAISLLVVSAHYAIKYARILSIELNFPELLIGIFILAFGTTLPELIFEITAVIKNKRGLLLGDPMGSVVVNSTLVLGIVSLIHPIEAPFVLFLTSAVFMLCLLFIFTIFVESERRLTVREGLALILLYILFLVLELSLKGTPGVMA